MRVNRVYIACFRSIKKLSLSPASHCALIGENNSRSNILRALNLARGETWPRDRSFSEEDFQNQDRTQDSMIQVFFDETMKAVLGKTE